MERRPALLVSTATAVALATAGFGYAATNLLTKPVDDQVGRLSVAAAAPPAPRAIQYVYDEVPVEVPAPDGPAPATDDWRVPTAERAPSMDTTTSTSVADESGDDQFETHQEDSHTDEPRPDDHDEDD